MEQGPQEELEHIPWSALADHQTGARNRWMYLAAAVIAALAIGLTVARSLFTPTTEPTVVLPELEPLPPPTEAPAPQSTPTPPPLYTEADLMAAIDAESDRAVATRAEWFVADYFTTSGDTAAVAEIEAALPAGLDRPELPHERPSETPSYVEWSRAVQVAELLPGRFRVTVAFRTVDTIAEGFVRRPVRAVDLVLELGPDGGAAVIDLPSPTPLPAGPATRPWPQIETDLPDDVRTAAAAEAGRWGDLPTVLGGAMTDGSWRVVVEVGTDESSTRWPMVVWIDQEGYPVPPGYVS